MAKSKDYTKEKVIIEKKTSGGNGFSAELKAALKELNDSYGEGSLVVINDSPNVTAERISSGSLVLDGVLGGGYAKGKIIEIFGEESTGKSTLALHFLSKFTGPTLYIDTEQSLDKDYAERLGVNLAHMIITQPETLEEGLEILLRLLDQVDAIVFDSIAEAVTKRELEGDMESQEIGTKAKLMSKAIRLIKGKEHSSTILFINQVRENPGITYGSNRVQPGGKAIKFASHVRLDVYGKELIKKGEDQIIGHLMRIKVVKNKLGVPHGKCEVPLMYDGYGISREQEILTLGIEKGIIEKAGSWIKHQGTNIAQGLENARTFLQDNPEFTSELLNEINAFKSAK